MLLESFLTRSILSHADAFHMSFPDTRLAVGLVETRPDPRATHRLTAEGRVGSGCNIRLAGRVGSLK